MSKNFSGHAGCRNLRIVPNRSIPGYAEKKLPLECRLYALPSGFPVPGSPAIISPLICRLFSIRELIFFTLLVITKILLQTKIRINAKKKNVIIQVILTGSMEYSGLMYEDGHRIVQEQIPRMYVSKDTSFLNIMQGWRFGKYRSNSLRDELPLACTVLADQYMHLSATPRACAFIGSTLSIFVYSTV
jgi:hypothetical protein